MDARQLDAALMNAQPYWKQQTPEIPLMPESVEPAPSRGPLQMGPIPGGKHAPASSSQTITPSVGIEVVRYDEGAGEYTLQTILFPAEWLA